MTDESHAQEKSKIGQEILRYLVDHPDAEDTLHGIVQWWLLERNVVSQTQAVRAALDSLVEKGLLLERRQEDSIISYRVKKREKAGSSGVNELHTG